MKPDPAELNRMAECPARDRDHTCIDLNMRLGWRHMLGLSQCDVCWQHGGLFSEEGERWRESKTDQVVATFSEPSTQSKLRRDVLVPLTLRHKTIPLSALTEEGEISKAIKRDTAWEQVKPSWEKADSWLGLMASFGKSAISRGLANERAGHETKNLRHISCFGTDLAGKRVKPACPWLAASQDGQHHYCTACGCGDKAIAHLDRSSDDDPDRYTKLDYPRLECPRRMVGFSNAEG